MANSPVTTYNIDQDRRNLDVSKEIARLIPDASPFTVMLMRARKKPTHSAYFYWYDSKPGGWWSQIRTATTDSETTIPVTDASIFKAKDIVKVPTTGEVMFVTATSEASGAHTITVERGYGTTPAAALAENIWLLRLGNAMEQFSLTPDPKITQPVKGSNLTQIFRRPFDQSMTSSAESVKTSEDERTRLRKDQALEHRLDIERAMLFGEKKDDANAQRQTTGGLLSFIESNFVDANNAPSESVLDTFCEKLFQYGSSKKLLVCSYRVGSYISQIAQNRIETRTGEETYGIALKQYKSFHGDLYIVPSRTLDKDYIGTAIGVDMDNVFYRPLKGRDTTLKTNIQANDADGWRDEYLTEAGLEVHLPETHCVLKNAAGLA